MEFYCETFSIMDGVDSVLHSRVRSVDVVSVSCALCGCHFSVLRVVWMSFQCLARCVDVPGCPNSSKPSSYRLSMGLKLPTLAGALV